MATKIKAITVTLLAIAFALAGGCIVLGDQEHQAAAETETANNVGAESTSTTYEELVNEIRDFAGGTLVLMHDCVCTTQCDPITVGVSMTLNLNGHVIDRNLSEPIPNGHVIVVENNVVFTIADSSGGGKITGGNVGESEGVSADIDSGCGGGIYCKLDSDIIMSGGTICGNKAACCGGGIYVKNLSGYASIISLMGGTVSDNEAGENGGGVSISTPTGELGGFVSLIMDGSEISGNKATLAGGGVYAQSSAIILYSGMITGNEAGADGGGIYLVTGTVTSSGAGSTSFEISENKSGGYGGGICIAAGAVVAETITVAENEAETGGGIALMKDGIASFYACQITDNKAEKQDGAIYVTDDWRGEGIAPVTFMYKESPRPVIIKNNIVDNKYWNLSAGYNMQSEFISNVASETEMWFHDDDLLFDLNTISLLGHIHRGDHVGRYINDGGNLSILPNPLVHFDATGGMIEGEAEADIPTYESFRFDLMPIPEKEGSVFLGWFTEPSGGTMITTETQFPETPGVVVATVYAQWEKEPGPVPQNDALPFMSIIVGFAIVAILTIAVCAYGNKR